MDSPQYAHFRPKYFPKYGISTNVNISSSCCRLSRHSRSASEYSSSSLGETDVVDPAELDGNESTSSAGSMFAYEDDGLDMVGVRSRCESQYYIREGRYARSRTGMPDLRTSQSIASNSYI